MTVLALVGLWPEEEMARLAALAPLARADLDPGLWDGEARVVVTDGHRGLSAAEIARLPRLGLVASVSAGLEGIDREALAARGLPLVAVGPALADEVADHAWALLLAAWRDLPGGDRHVRSGAWAREGSRPLGRRLTGRRLGVLGMGPVGRAVAARAGAFGVEVAWFARRPRATPWRHEPDLARLADWADILVSALPGGAATRGLVDARALGRLGPGGLFVNVGRGSAVDEEALIGLLASGGLGAAALDVFAREPDPDPRLLALPNVLLSPHAASGTAETRAAMSRLVVDNVAAFLAGRPLLSPV
jgi:lactate dehydrogenase-like 2-hydroxyacid dehydrogenase